jgi:hypothetical protein
MAKYKRQHFVPQWYQKGFSPDFDTKDPHIWVYDITSRTLNSSFINETAQHDYTYGKDGTFEVFLKPIESQTSTAITHLKKQNIRGLAPATRENILKFLILQCERTFSSKIITGNFNRKYLEEVLKPKLKHNYENLSDYIDFLTPDENLFPYMIKMALNSTSIISDLTPIVVKNITEIPFISSDNPVVKNNSFNFNKMIEQYYSAPGLQLICPLSDKSCLFLIHAELYKNIPNYPLKIETDKESDVNDLNKLQFLNCYQQILGCDNIEYLKNVHASAIDLRKQLGLPPIQTRYDDIKSINYKIHFSFLKNSPHAGKLISSYTKTSADLMRLKNCGPVRNEKLLREMYTKTDEVIASCMEEFRVQIERENLEPNIRCVTPNEINR